MPDLRSRGWRPRAQPQLPSTAELDRLEHRTAAEVAGACAIVGAVAILPVKGVQ